MSEDVSSQTTPDEGEVLASLAADDVVEADAVVEPAADDADAAAEVDDAIETVKAAEPAQDTPVVDPLAEFRRQMSALPGQWYRAAHLLWL